jgi:uncharacterized protein
MRFGVTKRTALDMRVTQLTVDPFTGLPVVLLTDEQSGTTVSVSIGLAEAGSIAAELERITLDRPTAHDLIRRIIERCNIRVDRVEIYDVRKQIFYARLHLIGPEGQPHLIDARASDAIAVALRSNCGIQVARKVIERSQRISIPASGANAYRDLLESLSDEEFGKWKM